MGEMCKKPFFTKGTAYEPYIPNVLNRNNEAIVLAEVSVITKGIPNPCILIKYSEFINFSLLGLNPKLNILYRLVREDNHHKNAQILQEWNFEFESADVLEGANIETNQPTVLNYCDCMECNEGECRTYRLEIVEIETNSVRSYGITNKSITATVLPKGPEYLCETKERLT